MFLCSLIDELFTKEESSKTGWSFNCFDQCISHMISLLIKKYDINKIFIFSCKILKNTLLILNMLRSNLVKKCLHFLRRVHFFVGWASPCNIIIITKCISKTKSSQTKVFSDVSLSKRIFKLFNLLFNHWQLKDFQL